MAKSAGEAVYRVTEVIGTSTKSWEDAAANAVATASKSPTRRRVRCSRRSTVSTESCRPTR